MIIYTSGTTGISKGVCLTHENIAFASKCYSESWKAPPKGRLFSFLPLAHIAERITNLGIGIGNRYAVYFCSDSMSIAKELKQVQPTIALAVPRLWDKLREGVEKRTAHRSHDDKNQIKWAVYSLSLFPLMYFTHRVWLLSAGLPSNTKHTKSTTTVVTVFSILYLLLTFFLPEGFDKLS